MRHKRKLRNRMAVIGVLLLNERSLTGYQIGTLSGLSPGTLYPILYQLEKDDIIKAAWISEPGDGPEGESVKKRHLRKRIYWWNSVR